MNHEIEAKIKVPTLEPIETRLKELRARFMHTLYQVDTYFMDMHKLLYKKDCGLRIRQETLQGITNARLTFKGARKDGKYKNRPEFETGIDSVETMELILDALGYHKRLVVEKQRRIWQLDSCEVCLDTLVRLGCFVEVEGPDEEVIFRVLEKLNLQNEPHISDSYARMTENALIREDSLDKRHLD